VSDTSRRHSLTDLERCRRVVMTAVTHQVTVAKAPNGTGLAQSAGVLVTRRHRHDVAQQVLCGRCASIGRGAVTQLAIMVPPASIATHRSGAGVGRSGPTHIRSATRTICC
jgi:hypothetical protein